MDPFDPKKTYLALHGAGEAKAIAVDAKFWSDLAAGAYPELGSGWLVAALPMRADWTHWEMHPEGEEILTLISGALDLIVEERGASSARTVPMRAGEPFVMPRGAWHRAVVHEPSLMFGITWGRGTQHRSI
jgi:mannose-6-phosphate isomerase-like protein (cupin superfamily)